MNVRKIKLETNKFPPDFHGNYIYDNVGGSFFDNIDIVLEELCAKYFLENYNDSIRPVRHYDQFDALHYLKDNIEEFIFKEGHPGAEQESRRIDSQVLGQTICRYVIEKTFGSGFISHVKPLLGKKFPGKFASISINRCKKGDSPDYIFMDNLNKPCLAEAKGRRDQIEFTDPVFTTWREQFSTVEVKINGNVTEVKGYIMALVIANEHNSISNSTLYVEDPVNEGEVYRDGLLGELIQMAHYERILSRSGLNFIGNSLLSEDKLSKDKKI
ncbi:hypothetical protein ACFOEQ_00645 [Chryseobacterium arachidis]|uniref:hypothetical protein n=1 Tax=Chryseobacterium arachidis TaxID=1416778 RepID=UPI00360A4517